LTPSATVGTTLHVAGTVTNRGDQMVHDAVIRVFLSDTRLNSRAELDAVMSGRVSSREGEVLVEAPLSDLAPGATTPFDLQQPLDDVPTLTGFGVYALGIEVVGARGASSAEPDRLAFTRTLLPWVPSTQDFVPTGFSWLWPLVGAPVRLSTGVFADDSLATELETGGRLDRLLHAGQPARAGRRPDLGARPRPGGDRRGHGRRQQLSGRDCGRGHRPRHGGRAGQALADRASGGHREP
jgi:hypothetical protein